MAFRSVDGRRRDVVVATNNNIHRSAVHISSSVQILPNVWQRRECLFYGNGAAYVWVYAMRIIRVILSMCKRLSLRQKEFAAELCSRREWGFFSCITGPPQGARLASVSVVHLRLQCIGRNV